MLISAKKNVQFCSIFDIRRQKLKVGQLFFLAAISATERRHCIQLHMIQYVEHAF